PAREQNCIRLELAMFCLSRSAQLLRPLLAERFPELTNGDLSDTQKTFLDAAWHSIGFFVEEGTGTIANPYDQCTDAERMSVLLWERLIRHGLQIDVDAWLDPDTVRQDLVQFEQRVLYGAALALLLDSLTVSEEQIAADHTWFRSHNRAGIPPA